MEGPSAGNVPEPTDSDLCFLPVTPERWPDLESLFRERGVQNGCWCAYWRIPRQEFQRDYGEANRLLLKKTVEMGRVPGILAYRGQQPVGWCSVAPREDFPVLGRSPTLKPVDDLPVWSIVCFFVSGSYRRAGMTRLLIRAAIQYARDRGASIAEAYPIDVDAKSIEYERYTGLSTTYAREGFVEAARRSQRRPVMRYYIR